MCPYFRFDRHRSFPTATLSLGINMDVASGKKRTHPTRKSVARPPPYVAEETELGTVLGTPQVAGTRGPESDAGLTYTGCVTLLRNVEKQLTTHQTISVLN